MIPYQIRIQPELLEEVQVSSKKWSEGNVNREIRDLIKIGLKNRKINTSVSPQLKERLD